MHWLKRFFQWQREDSGPICDYGTTITIIFLPQAFMWRSKKTLAEASREVFAEMKTLDTGSGWRRTTE